jgi:hypothetical protein
MDELVTFSIFPGEPRGINCPDAERHNWLAPQAWWDDNWPKAPEAADPED